MKFKRGNKWTAYNNFHRESYDDAIVAQILTLKQVTYKQFKDFLDQLDEERKSWSLDLQDHFKNDKELYEGVMKNNTP